MDNEKTGMKNGSRVPPRILSSLIMSLSAGVVPRSGAPYIAIGRKDETEALLSDLEETSRGGGCMRFLIGRYGSGKSFLMQLIRGYALDKGFVTSDVDLSPERRLYGGSGAGRSTYRELMKNLATKASPDGGALTMMIARWIGQCQAECYAQGLSEEAMTREVGTRLLSVLKEMELYVGGFDFARVITLYYEAYCRDDQEKQSAALRWLRGEYTSKTEARQELGMHVSVIIDDDNWYDFVKLWAALSQRIGYHGMVVFIDECVNLYKIVNRVSRENNYEKILSMFNDILQGRAPGLDIVFGGTPSFLEDTRRGLFSYEALRSRLCDSRFYSSEFKNMHGPVIRLLRLTDEELYALIVRVTALHEQHYGKKSRLSEEDMLSFLKICLNKAGADSRITPREIIRDYMMVLDVLMQNENMSFESLLEKVDLKPKEEASEEASGPSAVPDKKRVSIDDLIL